MLWSTDDERCHHVATTGFVPLSIPVEESFCVRVLDESGCVVVEDARRDPRFARSPYVDGRAQPVRFSASAPLLAPDRTVVGRLCVYAL